ncbi:hypothetical protein ACH5RR_033306 [Cinchona calisaya]|uniref:Late embryogenesis abundant protein n=1 Tax=Cinchona calisaya TaxID=153742 RepID=A0ABD2YPN5_9GENT
MLNALRLLRAQPPLLVSSPLTFLYNLPCKTCVVRFQQTSAGNSKPENSEKMDQSDQGKNPREESMKSYGEGYATRSDEEGFGGIYGENQEFTKKNEEKIAYVKVQEIDASLGSGVKKKEKGSHQKG